MMRSVPYRIVSGTMMVCLLSLIAVLPAAIGQEKAKKPDGKTLFEQKCLKCHKPEKFKNERHDRRAWEQILTRMQLNSGHITDDDIDPIADYLSKNYGE